MQHPPYVHLLCTVVWYSSGPGRDDVHKRALWQFGTLYGPSNGSNSTAV